MIDGDTVRLTSGKTVRLLGINTPEKASDYTPKTEPMAAEATTRLRALVEANQGRATLFAEQNDTDRHGRTLAHLVFESGETAAQTLIAEGLGAAVAIAPNDALSPCLLATEREARRQQRGLWGMPEHPFLLQAARARKTDKGFRIVVGRISELRRHKRGLTVRLDQQVSALLVDDAVVAADALQLKRGDVVELRGWVYPYKKWLGIRINSGVALQRATTDSGQTP